MNAAFEFGYCVTCPRCGRLHQKSTMTDSFIRCNKCAYEFYVYIKNGVLIEMPASQLESQLIATGLKSFAGCVERLTV